MLTMAYIANAKAGGITSFVMNREKGTLDESAVFLPDSGVAPLATSPNRRFLYAAIRSPKPAIASFVIDQTNGGLHHLGSVDIPAAVQYLTVDATGRFLLGASYGESFVLVMAIGREGFVQSEPVDIVRPGRNPHSVRIDASNRFVYVPLLGNDTVAQYRFDQNTGLLTPNSPPVMAADRESGPRHIEISPDNRFAYMMTEMGGEILTCAIDKATGSLNHIATTPVLPPDKAYPKGAYSPPVNITGGPNSPSPVMWTSEIRLTPDNRFLYASERTGSTLSHFRVDPVSGRLDLAEVFKTEKQPRGFTIDPFGRYLLAAGEKSYHISVYRIHHRTGALTLTDRKKTGEGPTWVESILL